MRFGLHSVGERGMELVNIAEPKRWMPIWRWRIIREGWTIGVSVKSHKGYRHWTRIWPL